MSQEALVCITDEGTVRNACRGWEIPLATPRLRKTINPFTGEAMERPTRLPEGSSNAPTQDQASFAEVSRALKMAKPVCREITLSISWREILTEASLFLIHEEDDVEFEVLCVHDERCVREVAQQLSVTTEALNAPVSNPAALSVFILMYSY